MTVSFPKELSRDLEPLYAVYRHTVNSWIAGGLFGQTYPRYLHETFHYTRYACFLLAAACQRLRIEESLIQVYLAKHISEEVGHEQWVLEDAINLGLLRDSFVNNPPYPETINIVGSQLHLIENYSPLCILGYIFILETSPPSVEILDAISDTYEIPSTAMKFLYRHSHEDQSHRDELISMLEQYPFSTAEKELIFLSASQSLKNITSLICALSEEFNTTVGFGNLKGASAPAEARFAEEE